MNSEEEITKSPSPDIKKTGDASHTLYSRLFNQHYHNLKGAVSESRHNFFETNGLLHTLSQRKPVTILEVGFGTGLNLLLLLDYYLSLGLTTPVSYHSIEAYPISAKTASGLNFSNHLQNSELQKRAIAIFSELKKGPNYFELLTDFGVHIFYGLFKNYRPGPYKADYIFHDAFSPDTNPGLWTAEVFEKLADYSARDVVLTTYSAASKARGAMASAGWFVASAPGALGKREMTVASLSENPLAPFNRVDEKRLALRYQRDDF